MSHHAGPATCCSGMSHRCTDSGPAAAAQDYGSAQINKPYKGTDAPFSPTCGWVQGEGCWRPPPAAQTNLPAVLPLPHSCQPGAWKRSNRKIFKNLPWSAVYGDWNNFETGGKMGIKKWMTAMKWILLKLFLLILPNFYFVLVKIL